MTLDDATRAWVARWIGLAAGDLELARLGLASDGFDVYELIGFHAQQTVEKLIKAFSPRAQSISGTSTTSTTSSVSWRK